METETEVSPEFAPAPPVVSAAVPVRVPVHPAALYPDADGKVIAAVGMVMSTLYVAITEPQLAAPESVAAQVCVAVELTFLWRGCRVMLLAMDVPSVQV